MRWWLSLRRKRAKRATAARHRTLARNDISEGNPLIAWEEDLCLMKPQLPSRELRRA